MLARLGKHLAAWTHAPWPWSPQVGIARTLLAVSTAGTLLFNPGDDLFVPLPGQQVGPLCEGLGRFSLFCAVPNRAGAVAIGLLILVSVMVGWRPRWTCLPHWWVASSLFLSASVADGGEQVSAVLTLLLLPICLTDRRTWHWSESRSSSTPLPALAARTGLLAVHIQVAFLYFHASVGKLGVEEWVNGTALYYWLTDPLVSAPRVFIDLASTTIGVTMLTWGTIAVEGALAFALFMPHRPRLVVIGAGFILHVSIWVTMGLASFSLAMLAALTLYAYSGRRPNPRVTAADQRSHASVSELGDHYLHLPAAERVVARS